MIKLLSAVCIAAGIILFPSTSNTYVLNKTQKDYFCAARPYGEIIQAILLQESLTVTVNDDVIIGDKNKKFGKRSYGPMQIKLDTALYMMNRYNYNKIHIEEDVLVKLLVNPEFNLYVSNLYFDYLLKKYRNNTNLAIIAYNKGPKGLSRSNYNINKDPYLRGVKSKLAVVKQLNNSFTC